MTNENKDIAPIPPQKVKVVEASFDEKTDTISWTVVLSDGRKADLVWLRSDYGEVWNKPNVILPVSIVKESCEKIVGSTVNIKVDSAPNSLSEGI